MGFWKKAAPRTPTLASRRRDNEQRIAAETHARLNRNKAAFYATIARMDRDDATPAVGKSTSSDRRTRI